MILAKRKLFLREIKFSARVARVQGPLLEPTGGNGVGAKECMRRRDRTGFPIYFCHWAVAGLVPRYKPVAFVSQFV